MAKRRVRTSARLAAKDATSDREDEHKAQFTFTSQRQTILNSLLATSADLDPVLLSILQELTDELNRVAILVDPAPSMQGKPPDAGSSGIPTAPIDFRYTLTLDNVILQWTLVSSEYTFFEIRKGTNWDTADKLLITNNASAILDPLRYGTHTFLLKALSTLGVYSIDALRVDITIPLISSVSIFPLVAGNAVTISWTTPTSTWRIDFYRVKKDGVQITIAAGTFFAMSEQIAGEHTFGIIPVDIAGNEGPESQVTVVTTGITDYIFYDKLTSDLNGILVNGIKADKAIYVCIDNLQTYEGHFINHGWASPQEQVNAGYGPWLSPFLTTASYEETFDFGVVIHSIIINVNWLYQLIYGNFTFGWEIQTSADGISWGPIHQNPQFYATEVRYVKVKILFTGENDLSLLKFTELSVSLNVKRENDGGFGTALASDTIGTSVKFNKAQPNFPVFVDVESITVTPISNYARFATYEFNDVAFPETFLVKIYDNAGVRTTDYFRWAARGIV